MTKIAKTVIFLIIMKIKLLLPGGQACWALFLLFFLSACAGKKEETPVIPPLTSPLSQSFIGYGVVNVSYTRVLANPEDEENAPAGNVLSGAALSGNALSGVTSESYLRQGSVVRILQRRQVKKQDKLESWVQVYGSSAGSAGGSGLGWLREALVDIYDNEPQARTASGSMGR